ncbi:uroporphyrinogen-III synthase [Oricola thermophila]|nr:uroporphyrinogen-III synthase [Oricola thermophila]
MSGAARPLVWITRPQPGADRTAVRIAGMGFEPLVLPLTEVGAVAPEVAPEEAERTDFVAATSGNAFRLAPASLARTLSARKTYVVGDATAAEARARGFRDVVSARGAVDDLVALIAESEPAGRSGLYLCGRRRTGDLEGKLAEKGISCRLAEVYETVSVSWPTEKLSAALSGRRPDAVLLHSALSAQALSGSATDDIPHILENARLFVLSERIAEALPGSLRARAAVAAAPNEENLLAALRAAFAA